MTRSSTVATDSAANTDQKEILAVLIQDKVGEKYFKTVVAGKVSKPANSRTAERACRMLPTKGQLLMALHLSCPAGNRFKGACKGLNGRFAARTCPDGARFPSGTPNGHQKK